MPCPIVVSGSYSIQPFLHVTDLFRTVDSETLDRIASMTTLTNYKVGEEIWTEGDCATDYIVIKRGMVRLVKDTDSGERSTLTLFGARETIGLPALLGPQIYPTSAIALTDSVEICRVPRVAVDALLGSNWAFLKAQNEVLLKMYFALQNKIDIVSSGCVAKRMIALFQYLALRFGDEDESGHVFIPVHLSRAQIADLVGARIETVIRIFSAWHKRKAFVSQRTGFVWDQSICLDSKQTFAKVIELKPAKPAALAFYTQA